MKSPLVIRPEAVADLESAKAWYEQRSENLGVAFATAAAAVLDRIAQQPLLFAIAWSNVRSTRLRRFPYVVYYRVLTDKVEVLAVLHGSRSPRIWKRRASD